jgi:hypothetical protein
MNSNLKKPDSKVALTGVLILAIFVFSSFVLIAVPSSSAARASLRLIPAKGHAGRLVKVTGLDFAPGATVTISVENIGGSNVATVVANSTGGFVTTFTLPALPCVTNGCVRVIEATDGTVTATHTFTVVPQITAPNLHVAPGGSVTINGTGYWRSSPLSVTLGTTTLSISPSSDSNGNCSFPLTVPTGTVKGSYKVTVTDETGNVASLTLHVS